MPELLAVRVCPAIELDVGELQIFRADLDREIDNLLDLVDVESMDDAVAWNDSWMRSRPASLSAARHV